ncbi:putative secretory lipase [Thelonectria olida]|uniref:Secretory lipase n=1 Tax=Thelonectria olida TaxID=1576542 RepID=A0A9P8W3J1_9HYPO|nr:putative secretory lipase [Thelonectria olida]
MRYSVGFVAAYACIASGQGPLSPQTNTFASNFELSVAQKSSLGLSDTAAKNINIAVRYEQTNWATGAVLQDPFYTTLPSNAANAAVGTVLKVEEFTDTSTFTLPPSVAMSRIIYQSKTLNGTLVPVSAYILWPYQNRKGARLAPLVSWGHGTSGIYADCAPSHLRDLYSQFGAPIQLAQAGYAVVASDYAGLGVAKDANGNNITHQFIASPSTGFDLLYAAQAARAAFPTKVTKEFVVFGHSQGGGAAWAAAQNQIKAKVPGYLGTVAAAPTTNALEQAKLTGSYLALIQVAKSIKSIYPSVSLSDILAADGIKLVDLMEGISGCNSALLQLITELFTSNPTISLVKDSFVNTVVAQQFADLTVSGGKNFKGPMLVIQGTADTTVIPAVTTDYVSKTCRRYSSNGLRYVQVEDAGHFPVLYAAQQTWMEWIDERFDRGSSLTWFGRCSSETIGTSTPRPLSNYNNRGVNYFLQIVTAAYQVA